MHSLIKYFSNVAYYLDILILAVILVLSFSSKNRKAQLMGTNYGMMIGTLVYYFLFVCVFMLNTWEHRFL